MMWTALLATTRPIQVNLAASNCTAAFLQRLLDRERLAHDAERGAVLGRDVGDVIGRTQRAGAGHVLGDHGRMAGQVTPEMARDQPVRSDRRCRRRDCRCKW